MAWFNPAEHDPSQGIPQLPVGNAMPAVIIAGTRQSIKDRPNDGMLVLTAQIIDGPNKGAMGAMRYNLWNQSSPENAAIAHRQLSALCHVISAGQNVPLIHLETENASELFGKPFLMDVAKQANNPEYTQVVQVTDIRGAQPTRQAVAAPAAQPQPQSTATPPNPGGWNGGAAPNPPASGAAQPSWNAPAQAGPVNQPAASTAPSWSQQPQGAPAGQPSWGRN